MMRLKPVKKPKSVFLKIAYFVSKRAFGKILSALSVIYARSTPLFFLSLKMYRTDRKLSLDNATRLLIRNYISHANNCPFCSDAIEYMSQKDKNFEFEKVKALMNFRQNPAFSDKEKALLSYLEEVNFSKTASDECFNTLMKHYNEVEIVEITWVCASENYVNYMAKPLGLPSDHLSALSSTAAIGV